MRVPQKVLSVMLGAAVVGFAACRDSGYADSDSAAVVTDTTAVAGTVEEYSDANIVAFLQTVNTGEIESAAVAKTKATNAELKAFARQIEKDHEALKNEVAQTAQRLGVSATGTDEDLLEDHQEAMQKLNEANAGKEFDDAYINHQVEAHKDVLDKLEDAIEKTQNAEFKSLLEKARAGIEGHLKKAQELDEKI
jgi:putative membrane protein